MTQGWRRLNDADAMYVGVDEAVPGEFTPLSLTVYDRGFPDEDAVEHLTEVMSRLLPALRCRLKRDLLSTALPRWVDVPDFDLTEHMFDLPAPGDGSLRAVLDWAAEWGEDRMPPGPSPVAVRLLPRRGGRRGGRAHGVHRADPPHRHRRRGRQAHGGEVPAVGPGRADARDARARAAGRDLRVRQLARGLGHRGPQDRRAPAAAAPGGPGSWCATRWPVAAGCASWPRRCAASTPRRARRP